MTPPWLDSGGFPPDVWAHLISGDLAVYEHNLRRYTRRSGMESEIALRRVCGKGEGAKAGYAARFGCCGWNKDEENRLNLAHSYLEGHPEIDERAR